MDTIVVIINKASVRKKVKLYLNSIGLGHFTTFQSSGTYGLINRGYDVNHAIDSAFDNKSELINMSKIVAVVNDTDIESKVIIDSIYGLFSEEKKTFDTGIVFSIPIIIRT